MGIPYSRQINSAFDQVTPLVAAGFEVLQTTKNIAILLACIQVFTTILLIMILLSMLGLICTLNPDLEREKNELVTPVVQYLSSWVFTYGRAANWILRIGFVVIVTWVGWFLWQGSVAGVIVPESDEGEAEGGSDDASQGEEQGKKKK